MTKRVFQKGSALLVVLLLITIGASGAYLYSKGKLDLNVMSPSKVATDDYVLTQKPSSSADNLTASTSENMYLTVTTPKNGISLKNGQITVTGKTVPKAEVFINDKSTIADMNGNFSINLTLDEGDNNLVVTANDVDGNVAEQTLTVNLDTLN